MGTDGDGAQGPDPIGAARGAAGAAGERLGDARAEAGERLGAARDAAGRQVAAARETAAMAAHAAAHKLSRKPRLRGVSHQWAFFLSLGAGLALVLAADTTEAFIAMSVYAFSLSAMLGTSALYHRVTWTPERRRWMRRLDHTMIFVFIAGTYTPFALLVMHGTLADLVLIVVWASAAGGVILNLLWESAPKWFSSVIYVSTGWVAIVTLPQLWEETGPIGVGLLALGGALYTAGAVVYARRRPDPRPEVFGYHEIFHVLVIAAAAVQYAAVAIYALPAG
ncbi:MAG TPA: hemolysin III family protein [Solirubrobacterales bacterium]